MKLLNFFLSLLFVVSTVLSAAVSKDDWIVSSGIVDARKQNPAAMVNSNVVAARNNHGIQNIAAKSIDVTNSTSIAESSTSPSSSSPICVGGTIAAGISGNFLGLCSYSCNHNHCPQNVCICTQTASAAIPAPTLTGKKGCPLVSEDSGSDYEYYVNLCGFTCSRGYCPSGACKYC